VELDRLDDPVNAQGTDEVPPLDGRGGQGSAVGAALAPRLHDEAGHEQRGKHQQGASGPEALANADQDFGLSVVRSTYKTP
jgi:hypothetical protein